MGKGNDNAISKKAISLDDVEIPFKTKILRKQLELLAERSKECKSTGELVELTQVMLRICEATNLQTGKGFV